MSTITLATMALVSALALSGCTGGGAERAEVTLPPQARDAAREAALVAGSEPQDPIAPSGAGGLAGFCSAYVALDNSGEVDTELAPDEVGEATKRYAAGLEPQLKVIADAAPAEGAQAAATVVRIFREAARSGDEKPLFSPELLAARAALNGVSVRQCGFGKVELVGVDYAYQNVPNTLKPGGYTFTFVNRSQAGEEHEMAIFRIKGADESPAAVAATGSFTAGADALPKKANGAFAELTAGRYAVICAIGVGGDDDAPSHYEKGMFATFTVA